MKPILVHSTLLCLLLIAVPIKGTAATQEAGVLAPATATTAAKTDQSAPAPGGLAVAPTNASGPVTGSYMLEDKHKLVPGDRVSFNILEDRTNALPLLVAESSELEVPYIGRVSVAGMTCKQAAEAIKTLLDKDYYYNATVIIGLDAMSKVLGRVYIYGPVRNAGAVEIPANENFTVSKAIMRAGGFGDFANKKKVQVIRKTETGNKTMVVNMENVLEKGRTEEDVKLEPEDYIIVPQRAVNFGL